MIWILRQDGLSAVIGSLSGLIFFNEFQGMDSIWQSVMYPIGIGCTIQGIYVLSTNLARSTDHQYLRKPSSLSSSGSRKSWRSSSFDDDHYDPLNHPKIKFVKSEQDPLLPQQHPC